MANTPIKPAAFTIAAILCLIPYCTADDKITTEKVIIPKTTVEFTLVKIPSGKIKMKDKAGKEKEVNIKPFWIGKTEVTWDEFDIFWMGKDLTDRERNQMHRSNDARGNISKPYYPPDRGWGHDGFPVGSISFKSAQAYCIWLSKITKHKYRLPTEAEWEYACRAGAGPLKPDKAQLDKMAWSAENSEEQTHKTATKDPNPWGLHDMLGNVAEWVEMPDGSAAVAGGSYQDHAKDIHSGARAFYDESWQGNPEIAHDEWWYWKGAHVGFRVVRED